MLESQEQPPSAQQQGRPRCDRQYIETRGGDSPDCEPARIEMRTSALGEVDRRVKRRLSEESDDVDPDGRGGGGHNDDDDDDDDEGQDQRRPDQRRASDDSQNELVEVIEEDQNGRGKPSSSNKQLRIQMIESSRQPRASQMSSNSLDEPKQTEHRDNNNNNDNDNDHVKVDDNPTVGGGSGESERRYRPQKYCAVCGDKAIACNFNAVTCESCKAFFRRNAFKELQLKCLFEKKCLIDRVTRRFCSKCRLLKCFEIGMKREWILTDEQKHIKRIKILQNKQSRRNGPCPPGAPTPVDHHEADTKLKSFHEQSAATSRSAPSRGDNLLDSDNVTTSHFAHSSEQDQSSDHTQSDGSEPVETGMRRYTTSTARQPLEASRQSGRVETRDAATCCPDESDFPPAGQPSHYCTLASQCQFCAAFVSAPGAQLDIYPNGPSQMNDHHHHHHHHQRQHQNQSPNSHLHQQQLNYLSANQSQPMLAPHQHQQLASHHHQQQRQHPHQQYPHHQPQAAHLMPNHHHHHHHYAANHQAAPPANQGALDQSVGSFYAAPTSGQSPAAGAPLHGRHNPQLAASTGAPATCCCLNSSVHPLQPQPQPQPPLPPPHQHAHAGGAYPPSSVPVSVGSPHHLVASSGHLADGAPAYPAQLHVLKPAQSAVNLSGAAPASGPINQVVEGGQSACSERQQQQQQQQQQTTTLENRNPFVMALEAHSIWDCNGAANGRDSANQMASNDDNDNDESLISNSSDEIRKMSSGDTMQQQYSHNHLQVACAPTRGRAQHHEPVGSSTPQPAATPAPENQPWPGERPTTTRDYIVWNGELFSEPASGEAQVKQRVERLNYGDSEKQLVFEMIEATRFLFEPRESPSCTDPRLLQVPNTLDELVHFCDAALRKLIKSVKQIKAFRILSMDDQIMLLKTACFKVLLLRSTFHFKDEIEGWQDSKTGKTMRLDILKASKRSLVYQRHRDMIKKIAEPLRRDRMVMSIMSMALLFDPNINLKHSNSVELDNLIYLSLMRKYLVETQPDPLAKYERLVGALQDVNACNDEYNAFFSKDFQPEQITPLLIEIFDISINNSM